MAQITSANARIQNVNLNVSPEPRALELGALHCLGLYIHIVPQWQIAPCPGSISQKQVDKCKLFMGRVTGEA